MEIHCRTGRAKLFSIIVFAAAWYLIAGPAWAETVKGNVRYAGVPVEKKKIPVTIDQYVCGKEKEPEDLLLSSKNGIRNAVVSHHAHADNQQGDETKASEQFCMDGGLNGRNPPNHGAQR